MMTKPMVTIGLTCFNAEETIAKAIKSALAQDWENKEILIVDDCSTDKSLEILDTFALQYPAIKIIKHATNLGTGAARNSLVNAAGGEFIAFFDDDDVSVEQRITKQMAAVLAFQQQHIQDIAVMSFCGIKRFFPETGRAKEFSHLTLGVFRDQVSKPEDLLETIFFHHWFTAITPRIAYATCNALFRVRDIKNVGGFDPNFRRAQDTDLIVRLALNDAYCVPVAEVLVHQTITNTKDKKPEILIAHRKKLFEKYQDYIQTKRDFPSTILWEITVLELGMLSGLAKIKGVCRFGLLYPRALMFQALRNLLKKYKKIAMR